MGGVASTTKVLRKQQLIQRILEGGRHWEVVGSSFCVLVFRENGLLAMAWLESWRKPMVMMVWRTTLCAKFSLLRVSSYALPVRTC